MRCILEGSDAEGDKTTFTLFFQVCWEECCIDHLRINFCVNYVLIVTLELYAPFSAQQNRHETDILLKEELDGLVRKYPTRVAVYYYLSNGGSDAWGARENEKKGYINSKAVQELMNPEKCQLVCLCGPSGFNEEMKNLLMAAGHTATSVYVW